MGWDRPAGLESNRTGGNYVVWVIGATGGGAARLTDSPAYDGSPAWSKKATDIAFVEPTATSTSRLIWLMTSNGTNKTAPSPTTTASPPSFRGWPVRGLLDA